MKFTNKDAHALLDPVVQEFLNSLAAQGGKPLYELPVTEGRKIFTELQSGTIFMPPVDIKDLTIPVGPKGSLNIHIYRPKGNNELLPVVIFIHGAGWTFGNQTTHGRLVREITNGAEAAVVFVDFTLAPEGQYPTAHEEGYAAAKWIAENGKSLNLDTTRMAIAGDSVGGLMATAITMMSKDRGGPKFIFQLLFYPVTDARFDTESYLKYEKGYFLEMAAMKWFWDSYVPDTSIRAEPYVSPLRASLEQLKDLPPALIITNENDVLRDEGEAYAHKLIQAGVSVVGVRYLGLTHDSAMLNALARAPEVRAMISQACHALKEVFSKK